MDNTSAELHLHTNTAGGAIGGRTCAASVAAICEDGRLHGESAARHEGSEAAEATQMSSCSVAMLCMQLAAIGAKVQSGTALSQIEH